MGFRNNFKSSSPVPCQWCQDRALMCHDNCEKYKRYKETNIAVSKARNEYKRKISLPDKAFK